MICLTREAHAALRSQFATLKPGRGEQRNIYLMPLLSRE
jgi:hypothetical protein